MTTPLHIGILETGRPPENLAQHGDYPAMVADWLAMPGARYSTWPVLDGDLPSGPDAADFWIITGSRFAVYENHPWIAPLEEFIRACRTNRRKMLGICFGHQVIARALGGIVEKSARGWGLGIHEYAPSNWPEALRPAPDTLRLEAFHQDQIITPPEGARCIARSDFCAYAALWYPGFALTVQGHPEFSKPYTHDLLTSRRGSVLPADRTDAALESLKAETTRHAFAAWVRDHLDAI